MSFVGLDVGGTYLKAALLHADGSVGPVTRRPVPDFIDTSGDGREISAASLLASVESLVADVVAETASVSGILVTGQMAGIAFVDAAGSAVAPIISWQDTRGRAVEGVAASLGPSPLADLGDGLRVGLPLVTLSALGVPADASVTSLLAYVTGSLCGQRASVVHATDAAAWGMYDVRNRQWSRAALALLGLDPSSLPAVSWEVVPVGTSAAFGVPVYCAVGDQQAALLGAGLDLASVSVNLATGCQVSVRSASTDSPAQLRPYVDGGYLHTITHLPAGRLLTAVVRDCRGGTTAADWAWAVEHASSDPRISVAVETVAQGVAGSVDRLGAGGRPVVFSGGLVQQFGPVREMIVDLLDVPARVYPGDDSALAGLGVLARDLAA